MTFRLRFPPREVARWAAGYDIGADTVPEALAPRIRRRGWLTRAEFLALADWKTPRTRNRCASNSPEMVRSVTRMALTTTDDRIRMSLLTLLSGVAWPTASVILHFAGREPYPILDVRALWSVSSRMPPSGPSYEFWNSYCEFTRALARRARVSMRTLDRALWQYSKLHQR